MSDDIRAALTRATDELIAAARVSDVDLDAAEVLWRAEPVDHGYLRACKAVAIGRVRLDFAQSAQIAAVEALLAYEQHA